MRSDYLAGGVEFSNAARAAMLKLTNDGLDLEELPLATTLFSSIHGLSDTIKAGEVDPQVLLNLMQIVSIMIHDYVDAEMFSIIVKE